MKTIDLIKALQEYELNDHGKEGHIEFWDTERECALILAPQSSDEPGIEHDHYMGCGCVMGFSLNFIKEKDDE